METSFIISWLSANTSAMSLIDKKKKDRAFNLLNKWHILIDATVMNHRCRCLSRSHRKYVFFKNIYIFFLTKAG